MNVSARAKCGVAAMPAAANRAATTIGALKIIRGDDLSPESRSDRLHAISSASRRMPPVRSLELLSLPSKPRGVLHGARTLCGRTETDDAVGSGKIQAWLIQGIECIQTQPQVDFLCNRNVLV